MVSAKCISKFRDKHGIIYGYRVQDASGQVKDFRAHELKFLIQQEKISISNLKLTSDFRLIDVATDDNEFEQMLTSSIVNQDAIQRNTNSNENSGKITLFKEVYSDNGLDGYEFIDEVQRQKIRVPKAKVDKFIRDNRSKLETLSLKCLVARNDNGAWNSVTLTDRFGGTWIWENNNESLTHAKWLLDNKLVEAEEVEIREGAIKHVFKPRSYFINVKVNSTIEVVKMNA